MLTPEKAADIFDRIRGFSSADEVEASFTGSRFALTRFANNMIHQNVEEENSVVSIRTNFGGQTARSTANQFDDESLRRAVAASESLARVQEPDPDLLAMPAGREADFCDTPAGKAAGEGARSALTSRFVEETAAVTPADRAEVVRHIVSVADQHKLTTAGIYSTSDSREGIFNSRGLARWHKQTLAEISITMLAGDSSGWQKLNSPDVRNLDARRLAATAAQKAVDSTRPQEITPGKYTVILEPAAVLDIVGFMFWDYSGVAILDQRSFLNDRIGTQLFGENINISDDVAHPLQAGSPFDGEGMRRQRVPLVENGVVNRVVYARATAKKMKNSEYASKVGPIEATGHGFPLPNEVGEMPMNIVFAGPEKPQSVDAMIASTQRAVLVTRLWYIREVDPYEKIVTGMTRDGTFMVENGKVQYGLRNFRFNQSLISMLSNVEAMSVPVRASGEESFDMVVPAMKVRGFNFTEATKF
ncbi:MAG TPA: TldD/PmbA family protein [Terriglobales bacterium]|jgi:PmbA protein|nr:TldD/PmbA family protein [Terriglobales bacterium]